MLTIEYANSKISYNAETGKFRRISASGGVTPGDISNSASRDGYIAIGVGGKKYKAHRLAWLLTYGQWPTGEIDHINGNKVDNRLANLRDVNKSQNMQNKRFAHAGSASKLLGAYKDHGRWRSQIRSNGISYFLGLFDSKEDAHKAYCFAKASLHGVCIAVDMTPGPNQ